MTDRPTITDDDLSLALDDEADAQLLARIDADPAARARLAELREAAELVGGSPVAPLADDTVDDLISTAIDTPVAPSRAGTRRGQRRSTPWLVAASVVILMALGLSLVWAGRGDDDDQAGATRSSTEQTADERSGADSSFSQGDGTATGESGIDPLAGAHGAPTTAAAPATADSALPLLYLGTYDDGAALRTATAESLATAWKASTSGLAFDEAPSTDEQTSNRNAQDAPSAASVDRCADQLQVTLSMKAGPIQTGYALVGDKRVLVYEFATTATNDADRETTLVAAVGADACDEVVIFER